MHMYLHHIIVCDTHDGITDRRQVFLKLMLILIRKLFLGKDDELRTISELYIRLVTRRCFHRNPGACRGNLGIPDLFSEERVICALYDFQKALSAGIHHPSFLEYRQHLRRLFKHFLGVLNHSRNEDFQIIRLLSHLCSLLGNPAGNGKDRALLRFHDRLVSRLPRPAACSRKSLDVNLFLLTDRLCEPPEQLGEDNS